MGGKRVFFLVEMVLLFTLIGCWGMGRQKGTITGDTGQPPPGKETTLASQRPVKKKVVRRRLTLGKLNQLTADNAICARPSWSPDGSKIVFHSTREPLLGEVAGEEDKDQEEEERDRDIWIMDRDGSNLKRLTSSSADDFDPVFSPDGKKIAYVSEENGSEDIWIMNADGTNKMYLTSDKGKERDPAWSPDGKMIAYAHLPFEKGGNFDIWVINVDGTGARRLTTSSANEAAPSWHPDGQHIAYHSDEGGNLDIYVIDIKGNSPPQKIIGTKMQESRPAWSPNGTKIAYNAWPELGTSEEAEIWVANIDGSSPYRLTKNPPNMNPSWSPDSTRIVFQSKRTGSWEIWDIEVPPKVLEEGRFAYVGMVRGKGKYDLLRLKNGDLLTGTVLNKSFTLRTSYAELHLAKEILATLRFVGGRENITQLILINGDKFSGFILEGKVKFKIKGGSSIEVRIEKVETIGFGYKAGEPRRFPKLAEITLTNGDLLSGKILNPSFTIATDYGKVEIKSSDIRKIENLRTEKSLMKITLQNGDMVKGQIEEDDFIIDLALGPTIKVYKDNILTILCQRQG